MFCSHIKIILPSKFTIPRKSSFTGGEVLPQSSSENTEKARDIDSSVLGCTCLAFVRP